MLSPMRIMISLHGDAPLDELDASLAAGATVLAAERLDPSEVATLSACGDDSATVERAGSALRALWIVDVATRADAVALARAAPGDAATLELREAYTPQDFGAPADAPSPPPPPPPPLAPGHARYIALIRQDAVGETSAPDPATMARMDAYMAPLAEAGTILGGQGLKPSAKGTRVRREAAQRLVIDGPFAESKELVGGYLIVQAPSLDAAVDLVRPWLQIHRSSRGVPCSAIEVRRLAS